MSTETVIEQPITIQPTRTATGAKFRDNTKEEWDKYCMYVGKHFIKLDDSGKPDPKFKNFSYVVSDMGGVFKEMTGAGNKRQFIIKIRANKRDRTKLIETTINGIKIKEFAHVPKHAWDGEDWEVVDEDGEHCLYCLEFDKRFKME